MDKSRKSVPMARSSVSPTREKRIDRPLATKPHARTVSKRCLSRSKSPSPAPVKGVAIYPHTCPQVPTHGFPTLRTREPIKHYVKTGKTHYNTNGFRRSRIEKRRPTRRHRNCTPTHVGRARTKRRKSCSERSLGPGRCPK